MKNGASDKNQATKKPNYPASDVNPGSFFINRFIKNINQFISEVGPDTENTNRFTIAVGRCTKKGTGFIPEVLPPYLEPEPVYLFGSYPHFR